MPKHKRRKVVHVVPEEEVEPARAPPAPSPEPQVLHHGTTQSPGGANVTRNISRMNNHQKETIISFMEENCELLNSTVSRLYPREVVEARWAQLTHLLNELGNVPKTTSTWKKTWFDLKREVKAKLGDPPYSSHLLAQPDDLSTLGQRGRIAALMTRAVRICQQHAANSLRGTLKTSSQHEDTMDETTEDGRVSSPPVVEMDVKCEMPDFAEYDIDVMQAMKRRGPDPPPAHTGPANGLTPKSDPRDVPPSPKRPSPDEGSPPNASAQAGAAPDPAAIALQMLAVSQDRQALAMEGLAMAARGLAEVFRQRNAVEVEKVEALKQIAQAIRYKNGNV